MTISNLQNLVSRSAITVVMLLGAVAIAQAPAFAPVASLAFTVTDGDCLPQSMSSSAGRTSITVSMASSKPQQIALSTTDQNRKYLFAHAQMGLSERWTTMIYLPVGTYELKSSLNGGKCTVRVQ